MKKIIFKILPIVIIGFFIIPQVSLAVWWNPFSWWSKTPTQNIQNNQKPNVSTPATNTNSQNFPIPQEPKTQTNITPNTTDTTKKPNISNTTQKPNAASTKPNIQTKKTNTPKKNPVIPTTPKQPTLTVIEKSNPQPTPAKVTPPPIETWAELEAKYFVSADQKGWTSQIITNALGEKRYYRKEGNQWVRKNSETEIQQPYVIPPTSVQLTNLRRVCLWDEKVKAICDSTTFMSAYYSNLIFRTKIDNLFSDFLTVMADQQKQRIATEIQVSECIMAPTPESELGMDPATQNYLRQVRCGTVTDADKTNYELSRIKSSVNELKYRLDQKISFPSLYLDPIKAPTFTNPQWQIRWEGSGGTISDSSGNSYHFRCEYNTCKSY